MLAYRKKYIEFYGELPEEYEVHYKLPIRLGGSDDLENLEAVSRKEHSERHKELYEKYGDIRDLCSYYMLSGTFNRKTHSSIAGKIGGKKAFENKVGIHNNTPELRREWASNAGKVGGKKQAELGLGFHYYKSDPERHRKNSSLGGKNGIFRVEYYLKQGFTEEEAVEMIRSSQSDFGKKGGVKNKGSFWINDGFITRKYTSVEEAKCSLDVFLKNNPQYKNGRLKGVK